MTDKTHVFYTKTNHYRDALIDCLPVGERARLGSMRSEARKKLFVLGRALLFHSLSRLDGCGDFCIDYHPLGKPILTTPTGWQFNLTHSGEHLFLALRQHHPIGIDSEILRPRAYQRLAEKVFSQTEQQQIADARNPLQAFYQRWTQYEAQVKYLGLSVFSDLPDTPKRYLRTYRHQRLIFSLCSDAPLDDVFCYRQDFDNGNAIAEIHPTQL